MTAEPTKTSALTAPPPLRGRTWRWMYQMARTAQGRSKISSWQLVLMARAEMMNCGFCEDRSTLK